ncbi:acyl-CoA N-acyltransferase [Auriculariales sp. MPI-PUGE-AT-0066]|nr:acyl-CoA N-acyltransferase [Auriculariales sp. MPI-PUGE-AT-0066]
MESQGTQHRMPEFHLEALASVLAPLSIEPSTGEPYLRLPAPHQHIILSRPCETSIDIAAMVQNLNDLRVARPLGGSPFPFAEADAQGWIARRRADTGATIAELYEAAAAARGKTVVWARALPLCVVRDTSVGAGTTIQEGRFIGTISFRRHDFDVGRLDETEREQLEVENEAKEAGDPNIVWELGDWLDPEYHGQGIMTAAVRCVLEQWAVPRMNAHHVVVTMYLGNKASVRVFEKNGFRLIDDVPDCAEIMESKGGGRTGLHVLEWRRALAD